MDGMTNRNSTEGLSALILDHEGDRSYARLSAACGGNPTGPNLHKMASRPIVNFPSPDVIIGLAKGLGVRVIDVLHAAAISVGLPIRTEGTSDLIVPGGAGLPEESRRLVIEMTENMLWWQEQVELEGKRETAKARASDAEADNVRRLRPSDWIGMAADRGQQGIEPDQLPDD